MGRKCRRELGIGGKFMIDLFLITFYALKYVFSLDFWFYGIVFIINSEVYENASEKLKQRWNEYKNK